MQGLASANDAAESAPRQVRGNEGQCAIGGLLRGDWAGVWGIAIAVWCGAQESGAAVNLLPLNL